MLDGALDAFLVGNARWSKAVLTGVAKAHAAASKLGSELGASDHPSANVSSLEHGGNRGGGGGRNSNNSGGGRSERNGVMSNGSSSNSGGSSSEGGVTVMSAVLRRGLLCPSTSSPGPASNGIGGGGGGSGGDGDDPVAAAVCLRLFRRVLQAGGAEGRAIAAAVGVPTEGAVRRQGEEAAKAEREPAGPPGGEEGEEEDGRGEGGPSGDPGDDPVARGRGSDDAERGGRAGGGDVDGAGRGRVRCAPPLTPALEVAVRLLADGYGVVVLFQVRMLRW